MERIKIAIFGVGNCASSLIQGIHYYRDKEPCDDIDLMHWEIGGYRPGDIEVVAAFDIDKRKVGKAVNEAVFAEPNCPTVFKQNLPKVDVIVKMGNTLDGFSDHMKDYVDKETFILADEPESTKEEIVHILKETGAEVIMNCLPVGSENSSKFYAYCALDAGVSFVNNTQVFIATNPLWALKFEHKNIPIIGDDIKSQFSDENSPDSAGAAIDCIRCAKLALNRDLGGNLFAPSPYSSKHTMRQFAKNYAFDTMDEFINDGKCDKAYRTLGFGSRKRRMALT